MTTAHSTSDASVIQLPTSAATLAGFRAWATSDTFPDEGRISYISDQVLIDMTPEEIEAQNKVKSEVSRVLDTLNRQLNLGTFYSDRVLITHDEAGLSTEPDGAFVAWDGFRSSRIRPVPRHDHPGEYVELEGTPDWVLEVVSRGSHQKDTKLLRDAYHRAGVPEYWLINALEPQIDLQILKHTPQTYERVAPQDGWHASSVFDRTFRLDRQRDPVGFWQYTLHLRGV